MFTIRPYTEKDREAVEKICIVTGPASASRSCRMRRLILRNFCWYYVEREPENCFVAADENGEAVGYILCAENYGKWKSDFSGFYLQKCSLPEKLTGMNNIAKMRRNSEEYPAHLHIDILPEYQHIGLGSRLVDRLLTHLAEKDIGGVMLGAGRENEKGIAFYKKTGFTLLRRDLSEVYFGKKTGKHC